MKNKSKYKLSELYDIKIGGTPSRNIREYWDSGTLPWVSIRDISKAGRVLNYTKEKITELGSLKSNVKLIKKGTLIMSFKLSIGKMAWAGCDLYTNEAICGFVSKNNNIIIDEYLQIILSNYDFTDSMDVAIKGATLNKEKLENLIIEVPESLAEQKRIAKIITCVDNNIDITEQEIKKLEQIKSGFFNLFYKFDNSLSMKFEDLFDVVYDYRGRTPLKLGLDWGNGKIKALSALNVKMDYIDFDKDCYLGSETLYQKWMSKGDCLRNDIIFTMEAPLGNVALLPDNTKYILSQRVILLRCKKKYNPYYIKLLMQSNYFQEILRERATGGTAKGIKQSILMKIELPNLPNKEQQDKIVLKMQNIIFLINNLKQKKQKLAQLKKGLLNDLL